MVSTISISFNPSFSAGIKRLWIGVLGWANFGRRLYPKVGRYSTPVPLHAQAFISYDGPHSVYNDVDKTINTGKNVNMLFRVLGFVLGRAGTRDGRIS